MHCWAPKARTQTKPNLLLIHGFGVNALWQWGNFVRHVAPLFNVYVPDLVFFGGSYTTRPERGERFQAECVMRVMEANGVRRVSLVGLSYGGFVAYCMAAMERETVVVERVVVCGSGVCMEERDVKEGLFPVTDLDEAASILVPQTPNKLKELLGYAFFKPTLFTWLPSCILLDFIEVTKFFSTLHLPIIFMFSPFSLQNTSFLSLILCLSLWRRKLKKENHNYSFLICLLGLLSQKLRNKIIFIIIIIYIYIYHSSYHLI